MSSFQELCSNLEEQPNFPGSRSKWTEKLDFVQPDLYDGIPVYRVMDRKGQIIDPASDPKVSEYQEVSFKLTMSMSIKSCVFCVA